MPRNIVTLNESKAEATGPKTVGDLLPGTLVEFTRLGGGHAIGIKAEKGVLVTLDIGSTWDGSISLVALGARILRPGETVTITVGE